MRFTDALKAMRRNVYVFKGNWRTFVFCKNEAQRNVAFDEARWILEASSIKDIECRYATRSIQMQDGAVLRFVVPHLLGGFDDAVKGQSITHAITLYPLEEREVTVVKAQMRPGDVIGYDDMLFHEVEDI